MKQTLEITGNVTDILLNGKSVYKQEQDNDLRMRCLRGEWEPKRGETVYPISPNGTDRMPQIANEFATKAKELIAEGYRFFPTSELRAEYKTIPLGKWLPKKGDRLFVVDKNILKIEYDITAGNDYIGNGELAYFPSEKQAQAWIDAHAVEPLDTGFSFEPKDGEWYLTITEDKKDGMTWHSDDSDKYNLSVGLVFRTEKARDLRIKYNVICAKVERAYCEVTAGYMKETNRPWVTSIASIKLGFASDEDCDRFIELAGRDNIEIASRPWLDFLRKELGK